MEISVTGQTMVFLAACVFGMILGLLYDVFRIFRVAVSCGKAAIFFQDVFFFLICALSTFVFMLSVNSGEVRFFVLVGELLGAVLYYFTIGYLLIKSARAVIGFLKKVVLFFARLFFKPVRFVAVQLSSAVLILLKKIRYLLKKRTVSVKTHLHVDKSMVYNLRSCKKRAVHKRKNAKRPEKRHEKAKKP